MGGVHGGGGRAICHSKYDTAPIIMSLDHWVISHTRNTVEGPHIIMSGRSGTHNKAELMKIRVIQYEYPRYFLRCLKTLL